MTIDFNELHEHLCDECRSNEELLQRKKLEFQQNYANMVQSLTLLGSSELWRSISSSTPSDSLTITWNEFDTIRSFLAKNGLLTNSNVGA